MWCPRCGAEYREGFSLCSDCNVALVGDQPLMVLDVGDHDLARYDVGDWTDDQRRTLGLLLTGAGLPFEWDGQDLLVPSARRAELEPLLEDVGAGVASVREVATVAPTPLWSISRALDWIGTALACAVAALAVAGVGGAVDLAEQLPVPVTGLGSGILTSEVFNLATEWASPVVGVMLLGAVGAIVVPRLLPGDGSWRSTPRWPGRARRGLYLLLVMAVIAAAAELTSVGNAVWQRGTGGPFGISNTTLFVGSAVGAFIPTIASLIAVAFGLRQARASETAHPSGIIDR